MKLKENRIYKITKQISDFALSRRMAELGFTIGTRIKLNKISLLKRNYLFTCREIVVSLSKDIVLELGLVDE